MADVPHTFNDKRNDPLVIKVKEVLGISFMVVGYVGVLVALPVCLYVQSFQGM